MAYQGILIVIMIILIPPVLLICVLRSFIPMRFREVNGGENTVEEECE